MNIFKRWAEKKPEPWEEIKDRVAGLFNINWQSGEHILDIELSMPDLNLLTSKEDKEELEAIDEKNHATYTEYWAAYKEVRSNSASNREAWENVKRLLDINNESSRVAADRKEEIYKPYHALQRDYTEREEKKRSIRLMQEAMAEVGLVVTMVPKGDI